MIQITPMRPNLTYQNHFDGALGQVQRTFALEREDKLNLQSSVYRHTPAKSNGRSKWVVGAGLAPALDTRKGCPYNRN
jgi:hypothetical protein